MHELWPDVVLPISNGGSREACLAVGASTDEVLWLSAAPRRNARATSAKQTSSGVQIHSYRSGPQVTTRPYTQRRRPDFLQRSRGGFLFVSARAKDNEPNACWVDGNLKNERRFSLGDGISDVRVAPSGQIWTTYLDEGIFGGGVGAAGLVEFDAKGRKLWAPRAAPAGTDDMAEVYAFNLASENDAWVYFYNQFAIVRWLRKRPTVWRTRVEGARAIAIQQNRALLFGDYDDPTAIRVLDLPTRGGTARVARRLQVRLPPATDLTSVRAYGAAHRLVLCSSSHLMIVERW